MKKTDRVYSLCEAVADLSMNMALVDENSRPEDSRSVIAAVIQWATLFEQKNEGRLWDGEYIEKIDQFFVDKFTETYGYAPTFKK